MRFLIRAWSRHGGENEFHDRQLDCERLRIGRGTDQDIELPDLRVAMAHAEVVRSGDTAVILTKPGAAMLVNGTPKREHKLRGGEDVAIGRYRLTFHLGIDGVDLQINVEERVSAREEKSQRQTQLSMTLGEVLWTRRRLSWLLFLPVLLLTLALPVWLRFNHPAPPPSSQSDYKPPQPHTGLAALLPSDHFLVPGQSSSAHAYFQKDCAQCHKTAFDSVPNEACLGCHKGTKEHVNDVRWLKQVDFAEARCGDCHREHMGDSALVMRDDTQCASCHAQPQLRFPGIQLQAAADFSQKHPSFTPMVARYDAAGRQFNWIEARQDQPTTLHSDTNLKFPHDLHLNPKGLKSPDGKQVLVCADCHEADSSGVSFKPINMEKHCAACHRLDFDPDDPDRVLPHAQPVQVFGVIRDYYARAALNGGVKKAGAPEIVQLRRRPGEQMTAPQARAALAWADHESSIVIDEVFDKRVCGYCHTVGRSGDRALPWSVAPVAVAQHQLSHASFSHAAHSSEKCESCHNAGTSKLSTDVLLPDLKRCRDCHGDPGSASRITSTCIKCHGYHTSTEHEMGTQDPPSALAATVPPPATKEQPR